MEIGWSELLVVAVVALVVIGPKDLPEMFRTLGRFTAKLRAMAREFSRAMEDAAKESGVQDVANDLRKVTSPKSMGLDAVKSAADKFEKWDPLKTARGSTAATTAAVGGAVQPAAAAAAGLGSAVATGNAPAAAPAGEGAIPDPNAPAPSVQASPERGPHTSDLAMKRAEREAIAREAAERLRKTQPPAQSTASAFEDAPATVIAPAVTSTPLAETSTEKPAAKRKPAAKPAAAKPVDAPETPKRATRKPAAKAAVNPDPAQQEAAKPAAKRRAPAKKAAAKTGSDEAKDQA